jgi:hypothetical protein
MRYIIITLTLAAIVLSHAAIVLSQNTDQPTNNQRKSKRKTKVEVRYDKATDTTKVWLEYMTLWENPVGFERVDMSVSFEYPKRIIATPKSVVITIHSATKGGQLFEDTCDLVVIADGSSLNFGNMQGGCRPNRSLTPGQDTFFERLSLSIPYEDFSRMAKAGKVKLQVGGRAYNLSEKQLQSLSDFLELMQQEGQEFK